MPELNERIMLLESRQESYERQRREHEERQRAHEDVMNKMAQNIAVMNSTLKTLTDQVMPRVQSMEQQVIKNTMITTTVAWVASALVVGAITLAVALIK